MGVISSFRSIEIRSDMYIQGVCLGLRVREL